MDNQIVVTEFLGQFITISYHNGFWGWTCTHPQLLYRYSKKAGAESKESALIEAQMVAVKAWINGRSRPAVLLDKEQGICLYSSGKIVSPTTEIKTLTVGGRELIIQFS